MCGSKEREFMMICISIGRGKIRSVCPDTSRNQAKEILTAVGVQ